MKQDLQKLGKSLRKSVIRETPLRKSFYEGHCEEKGLWKMDYEYYNETEIIFVSPCSQGYEEQLIPRMSGLLITSFTALIMTSILVSSVILIFGLWKTKQTELFMHKLIILLGVLDLFIATVVSPVFIGVANNQICELSEVHTALSSFVELVTILVTLVLSIDRYIFIAKSNLHQKYNNNTCFFFATFIIVTVSVTTVALVFAVKRNGARSSWFILLLAVIFTVLLFSTLVPNAFLYRFIRRKASTVKELPTNGRAVRYEQKATTTIQLITLLLIVTYVPAISGLFYISIHQVSVGRQNFTIFTWLCLPWTLNSCLNNVVFISRNVQIRSYFRKLLRKTTKGLSRKNINQSTITRSETVTSIACT